MLIDDINVNNYIFNCDDFECNLHEESIMNLLNEVLDAMVKAANIAIPKKRIGRKSGLPG